MKCAGYAACLDIFEQKNTFVIAGHISPDGDAIGSCFGLAHALASLGKKVDVVLEPYADKFLCIPGAEFLYGGSRENLSPEVFIAVDCADAARLGAAQALFERAPITVCIDHHETNAGFAQINYLEPCASSTSEMCLRLIEEFMHPTIEIASAIYAGLVCDTGGFRYNATGKSTMETAARLLDMKIPFTEIYNELMHKHSFGAGKALGIVLHNSRAVHDGKIICSHISKDELQAVGADSGALDGVVEYLMDTSGTLAAVLTYEKPGGMIKVSLRSAGPNMARVAQALGGGGHQLAAGATVAGSLADVLARALELVKLELAAVMGNAAG